MWGCDEVQVVYPINDLEGTIPVQAPKPLNQENPKSDDPSPTPTQSANPIIQLPENPQSKSIIPDLPLTTVTALKTVTVKNNNLGKSCLGSDLTKYFNMHLFIERFIVAYRILSNQGLSLDRKFQPSLLQSF